MLTFAMTAPLFETMYDSLYFLGNYTDEDIAGAVRRGLFDGMAYERITGKPYVQNQERDNTIIQ